MECNIPHTNAHLLAENINSSSGSRTNSDVEDVSDEIGSLSNSNGDEGEDIDISFSGQPW